MYLLSCIAVQHHLSYLHDETKRVTRLNCVIRTMGAYLLRDEYAWVPRDQNWIDWELSPTNTVEGQGNRAIGLLGCNFRFYRSPEFKAGPRDEATRTGVDVKAIRSCQQPTVEAQVTKNETTIIWVKDIT